MKKSKAKEFNVTEFLLSQTAPEHVEHRRANLELIKRWRNGEGKDHVPPKEVIPE